MNTTTATDTATLAAGQRVTVHMGDEAFRGTLRESTGWLVITISGFYAERDLMVLRPNGSLAGGITGVEVAA